MFFFGYFAPNQASFSNHSNICGFFPIPLIAKLLSSGSWCQTPWLSPHPTVSPGKGRRGGEQGEAAPTQHSHNLLQLRPLQRASEGGREGEQQENNSGYLSQILQLERGERDDSSKQEICFLAGQGIRVRSLSGTTAARSSSAGVSAPRGLCPRAGLPPRGGKCSPKVLLPWESPAPPAPRQKQTACHGSSCTGMGRGVSNTVGLVALSSRENGI